MDHRFTQSIERVYAVVKSLEMGETMARSYDLTSGSIPQHLLRLAAPLIMGNILQQLYNTVDAFILGRFAGDLEFAAVGVAGSVMNLFLFMITGACTGISVIFAQLYGAGERERFRREHWLSLSCGLLVTLACSGLGFLLLSPLLRLIQTPSELKTFVSVYLTIILASLPAVFLYNLYGALLRAIGRANAALMVLAAAVTVNVALDYCFVARFQLGIAGAAWATAASQAISAVLCILYLRRKAPELIFARADCRMDGELLKKTAHFSFVTALHQSSLYIGKRLVQGAVNTGGTDMIARLLNHRLRHLSMGKLMLAVDGCVVLFSAIVYKSIESAVYACIVIFVSTKIIDTILYGTDAGNGKMFFIMSRKNDVIADRIIKEMDRGLTFLKSRSGYLKQDGEVLFCAVRRFEVFRISEIIREEDPDAFVIVGDAGEIAGEGFKPVRSDDRTLGEIIKAIRKTDDKPVREPKE